MATVCYYFSLVSPYAYLGHAALQEVVRRHGATLDYRPVRIFDLFEANGGLPLPQRAPARQRYRLIELQRWREQRGRPLNLQPRFWPVDIALADRCAIALTDAGRDPAAYMEAAFRALWADDRDLADMEVAADLLQRHGHDAVAVLAAACTTAAEEHYRSNTRAAIAADLPGLPGYVLGGEPFWGQDRIDQLDVALATDRSPFVSD